MYRPFNLLIAILYSSICLAQVSGNEYYDKDFNWRIKLPAGFTSVSADEWKKTQQKGIDAVEKTYGEEVDNQAKVIFVLRSGDNNYLEANWQPFDPVKDGDYYTSCRAVYGVLYETFKAQLPDVKADTTTSEETIAGVRFLKLNLVLYITKDITFRTTMYNHLFGKKDFTVNIIYTDEDKGKLMMQAWKGATFGK